MSHSPASQTESECRNCGNLLQHHEPPDYASIRYCGDRTGRSFRPQADRDLSTGGERQVGDAIVSTEPLSREQSLPPRSQTTTPMALSSMDPRKLAREVVGAVEDVIYTFKNQPGIRSWPNMRVEERYALTDVLEQLIGKRIPAFEKEALCGCGHRKDVHGSELTICWGLVDDSPRCECSGYRSSVAANGEQQ